MRRPGHSGGGEVLQVKLATSRAEQGDTDRALDRAEERELRSAVAESKKLEGEGKSAETSESRATPSEAKKRSREERAKESADRKPTERAERKRTGEEERLARRGPRPSTGTASRPGSRKRSLSQTATTDTGLRLCADSIGSGEGLGVPVQLRPKGSRDKTEKVTLDYKDSSVTVLLRTGDQGQVDRSLGSKTGTGRELWHRAVGVDD